MKETVVHLFNSYPGLAIVISIGISILVAVIGILPSVFVTAANIIFFGFWTGTFISFLGESIGAGIAFVLYRKGFKKRIQGGLQKYKLVQQLMTANNKDAFSLVFALRLVPFIPSGLITFAAAIGRIGLLVFLLASSLGKLPALLLEAYSVYEVTQFGWQGKLILLLVALGLIYWVAQKKK